MAWACSVAPQVRPAFALTPPAPHQRLEHWLWCARFVAQREACARWVEGGAVRINRQPTDKPHAKLRVGDVLTLKLHAGIKVVRVLALAARRGAASEARALYEELPAG